MTERNGITWREWWAEFAVDLAPPIYYVYKLYNSDDELIYVGKTKDVRTRFLTHWHNSGWLLEVKRMDLTRFTTREEAETKELELIRSQRPRHNRRHAGRAPTPGGYMVENLPYMMEEAE